MRRGLVLVSLGTLMMACSAADTGQESAGEQLQELNCSNPSGADELNRCSIKGAVDATASTGANAILTKPPITPDFKCTYEHGSQSADYLNALLGQVGAGGLFPGALHPAVAVSTRDLSGPRFSDQTMPAAVTVDGIKVKAGASYSAVASKMNKASVLAARDAVLTAGEAVFTPNIAYQVYDWTKIKELELKLKVKVDFLKATFNLGKNSVQTELVSDLQQDYYDLSVAQPLAENFFTSDVTPQHLATAGMEPGNPFTYVSRVTYGRKLLVHIKSNYQRSEVDAALAVAIGEIEKARSSAGGGSGNNGTGGAGSGGSAGSGAGSGGAGGASAGAGGASGGSAGTAGSGGSAGSAGGTGTNPDDYPISLSFHHKKVLDELQIDVLEIGGGTSQIWTGKQLVQQLLNGIKWDTAATAKPLRFSMNHFATGAAVGTFPITDFYTQACGTRKHDMQVELKWVELHEAGDAGSNGEPTWRFDFDGKTVNERTEKAKVSDGTTFYPNATVSVSKDLSTSPSVRFGADFHEWNKLLFGGWREDQSDDFSWGVTFRYEGTPAKGKWNGSGSSVDVNQWNYQRSSAGNLDAEWAYRIRRAHPGCVAGQRSDGLRCIPVELGLNDVIVPELAHCTADPLIINTSTLYATRQGISNVIERYDLSATQIDPITRQDIAGGAAWSEPVTMDQEGLLTPYAFDGMTWAINKAKAFEPGKAYRLNMSSYEIQHRYDLRFLPIQASFTVSGSQSSTVFVDAGAPLNLDTSQSCGFRPIGQADSLYTLTFTRFSGATPTDNVSRQYAAHDLAGFDLRSLAAELHWSVLPGDHFKVELTVPNGTSTPSMQTKDVYIRTCASGTAWNGSQCEQTIPTTLRLADTTTCLNNNSGTFQAGLCTPLQATYALVPVAANQVLIQSASSGQCLVSPGISNGPPLERACDGSADQVFEIQNTAKGGQIVSTGGASAGNCLALYTASAFGSCSLSAANEFAFSWTPATPSPSPAPALMAKAWDSTTALDTVVAGTVTTESLASLGTAYTLRTGTDSISAPASAPINVGTKDFAVAMWVKTTDTGSRTLASRLNSSSLGYALWMMPGGGLLLQMNDGSVAKDGSSTSMLAAPAAINDGGWHHVAASVDRDVHDGMAIYVDGVLLKRGSPLLRRGNLDAAGVPLRFGGGGAASAPALSIAGAQLFKRALGEGEVTAMTQACSDLLSTPPSAVMSGEAGQTLGTLVGGATLGAAGRVGGALSVNAGSGYLEMPASSAIDMGTSDFSLAFWVKTTSSSGVLLDKRTSEFRGYHVFLSSGRVGIQLATGAYSNWVSNATISDGAWHHVTITVDRDSPTGLAVYLDGALVNTWDARARSGTLTTAAPLRVGAHSINLASTGLVGLIDELRFYKQVLPTRDISALAAGTQAAQCK